MLDKKIRKQYSLTVGAGALVLKDHRPGSEAVVPGSPADKAGVQENDVIVELNGEKVLEDMDLRDLLQKYPVGSEIELTVLRKDQQLKLKATLEERK